MNNKAVLISIRPEWCQKILNGEKTIEIRKNKPKLELPFKCYIYCTGGPTLYKASRGYCLATNHEYEGLKKWYTIFNQRIIGEFTCNEIITVGVKYSDPTSRLSLREFPFACLTDRQVMDYLGNGIDGYGWHISNLKIYETPREISEFRRPCKNDLWCESCGMYSENRKKCGNAALQIIRPPQSWCYVEDVEG